MSKGTRAFAMLEWTLALFLQTGGTIESASHWEDVKKLEGEDLESLPAKGTYRNDDLTYDRLNKLVKINSLFRKQSALWGKFILTIGWSLISLVGWISDLDDSDVDRPFPSENLALLEIAAAYPYAYVLWWIIPKKWYQEVWLEMLKFLGPFFVAVAWYILSFCNALWKWTYAFSTTTVFRYGFIFISSSFTISELVWTCWATMRLRQIRRFLGRADRTAKFPLCQLDWPWLNKTQTVLFSAQLICIFVANADIDQPEAAVFEIAASTCYLLILLAESPWEDLVFRRAWKT